MSWQDRLAGKEFWGSWRTRMRNTYECPSDTPHYHLGGQDGEEYKQLF